MPDLYNDIYMPEQGIPNSGIDLGTPVNPLSALYQPISFNKPIQQDSWYDNAMKKVSNSPDYIGSRFASPAIKTPVATAQYFNDNVANIGYDPTDPNLEYKYGDAQGGLEKLGRRFLKFGSILVGNFFMDLGEWYSNIDNKIHSSLGHEQPYNRYRDEGIQYLSDWMEKVELENPNHQTSYNRDHPMLSWIPIYGNNYKTFLDNGGNLLQQFGFTAAAAAASFVETFPLVVTGGAIMEGAVLPKQLAKINTSLAKLGRAFSNENEYLNFVKSLNKNDDLYKAVMQGLNEINTSKKIINKVNNFIGDIGMAQGEAANESIMTEREIRKSLMEKYSDENGNFIGGTDLMNKIKETSMKGGDAVFTPNFAFLTLSNMIGYGAFTKPAKLAMEASEKMLGQSLKIELDPKNINKFIVTPTKKTFGTYLTNAGKFLGTDNIKEAVEEGYQQIVSDTAKNYYTNNFDKKGLKEAYSYSQAISDATTNLFSSREGFDTMLMGYLGGIFQGKVRNLMGYKSPNSKSYAAQIVNNLNATPITSIFNMEEAVTNTSLLNQMEEAINNNDLFQVQNLKFDQLFNTIHTATTNHKFDARLIQMDGLKNLDADNFQFMWGAEKNAKNEQIVNDYVDGLKEKAVNIKEHIEKVEEAFGQNPFNPNKQEIEYRAYNTYKKELAYSLSSIDNYKNRENSVKHDIQNKVPSANIDDIIELSSEEGINRTIQRFNNRIEELKNNEELSKSNQLLTKDFKEERQFLERKVKELEWATQNNQNYTQDFMGTVNDIYNYYGNVSSLKGDFKLNPLESPQIFEISKDVHKLKQAYISAGESYIALAKKDGFNKFYKKYKQDYLKFVNDIGKDIIIDENGKMSFKQDELLVEETSLSEENISEEKDSLSQDLEKIQNNDKEFIAKTLDPNYENEPDSEAAQIARGEIEPTEDHLQLVKDRVIAEHNLRLKEKKINPKKSNRISDEELNEDVSFEDELNEKLPLSKKEIKIEEQTEDNSIESDSNNIDKVSYWKKFKGNIVYLMEKVLSRGMKPSIQDKINKLNQQIKVLENTKSPTSLSQIKKLKEKINEILDEAETKYGIVDHITALKNIIFSTTSKEQVQSKIYNKLNILIKRSEEQKNNYQEKYFKIDTFSNIFRKNNKQDIVLSVGDKEIGILSSPLLFKKGEEYLPLTEMTKEEYVKYMQNPESTYDSFMKEYSAYKKAFDSIDDDMSNEELLKLFTPHITYGKVVYDNQKGTQISNLEYKNKGSMIISYPLEFDETTNTYKKATQPTILNQEKYSENEIEEVLSFIEKNQSKINNLDKKYYYVMRMPDGSLNKDSLFAANLKDENLGDMEEFTTNLKEAIQSQDEAALEKLNQELKEAFHITHRRAKNSDKTNLSFSINNNQLQLNVNNQILRKGATIQFSNEEISNINNFQEFIDLINHKISEKKQETKVNPQGLTYTSTEALNMKQLFPQVDNFISEQNFKSLKEVEGNLEENLTIPTTPEIFQSNNGKGFPSFAITLLPNTGQKQEVKPIETKVEEVVTEKGNTYEVTKTKEGDTVAIKPKETTQKQNETSNIQQPNILNQSSNDIITNLNKLNSIQEKLEWLKNNGWLQPITIEGKSYNSIDYNGRVMVLMKIGNLNIPFYISTGQAGKKNVKAGNWYAVFGIGEEKGWINKGTEEQINTQYGQPILEKLAKILNDGIGTIESREDNGNGRLKEGIGFLEESNISEFNKQMNLNSKPAGDNSKVKEFYDHVTNTLNSINEELKQINNLNTSKKEETIEQPKSIEQKIVTNQTLTIEEQKQVEENPQKVIDNIVPEVEIKGSLIDRNFASIIKQLQDKLIIKKDC